MSPRPRGGYRRSSRRPAGRVRFGSSQLWSSLSPRSKEQGMWRFPERPPGRGLGAGSAPRLSWPGAPRPRAMTNLYELIHRRVRAAPQRLAIETPDGERLTYAELDVATAPAWRPSLAARPGVAPGDRVAVQVEKSPRGVARLPGLPAPRRDLRPAEPGLHGRGVRLRLLGDAAPASLRLRPGAGAPRSSRPTRDAGIAETKRHLDAPGPRPKSLDTWLRRARRTRRSAATPRARFSTRPARPVAPRARC